MATCSLLVSGYDYEKGRWISGIQMKVEGDAVSITGPYGGNPIRIRLCAHRGRPRGIRNWFGFVFKRYFQCARDDIVLLGNGKECELHIGPPLEYPYRFRLDSPSDGTFSCLKEI